jgi:hypothetical protein
VNAHPHRGAAEWTCAVCGQGINRFEDPHTYHAENCPLRDPEPHSEHEDCAERYGCGEDVHESCCPTCTGQAFAVDRLAELGER